METIKIDDEVVRISDMPEALQNLVSLYEEALNQEMQARKDLAIREAARMELTRRIVAGYREVKEAAAKAVSDSQEVSDADQSAE